MLVGTCSEGGGRPFTIEHIHTYIYICVCVCVCVCSIPIYKDASAHGLNPINTYCQRRPLLCGAVLVRIRLIHSSLVTVLQSRQSVCVDVPAFLVSFLFNFYIVVNTQKENCCIPGSQTRLTRGTNGLKCRRSDRCLIDDDSNKKQIPDRQKVY